MWLGLLGNQEQSSVIDKAALETILGCLHNEEMTKAQAIQAINRLAAHAFSQEQSEARQLDRNKQKSYPKNDYTRWDERDEQRVMTMRAQGYEYDVIARELRRTTRSVRTKFLEVKNLEAKKAQEKLERI
jgi:DNA-binding NarL/FixJ family response regulator